MKMARASQADMDATLEVMRILNELEEGWMPSADDSDDAEHFDRDNSEQCRIAIGKLLDAAEKGSIFRVIFGMQVVLDPRNELLDPDADTIERHPKIVAALNAQAAATDETAQLLSGKNGERLRESIEQFRQIATQQTTAKQRYDAAMLPGEEQSAIERLRFFCSLAMSGQDWIDAEPFFDALAAPRQPGEMGAGVQDEREACPQCNGQRWIFRGNGEDTECEACIVEGWPADESALNEAVEVLRDMLETRNEEAKAEHAYKVAEENYTSSKREFDILTMTMSAAAMAEQRARYFLAKVKAGKHDSTAQQVQADAGAVAKDAERYRWLRDENIVMADDQRSLNVVMGRLPFREDQKDEDLFGNDLDEAIDAAMSREQSGGGE